MAQSRSVRCCVIHRVKAKDALLWHSQPNNLPSGLLRSVSNLMTCQRKLLQTCSFPQALHQSQTMEGCSAPLVVKFADTQKEKDAKRVQSIQSNLWNFAAGLNSPMAQSPVPVASPVHSNPPAHTSPYLTSDSIPAASLQLLQQIQTYGLQQQLLHGKLSFIFVFISDNDIFLSFRIGTTERTASAKYSSQFDCSCCCWFAWTDLCTKPSHIGCDVAAIFVGHS